MCHPFWTGMFRMCYACEPCRFRIVLYLGNLRVTERVCLWRDAKFRSRQNFDSITLMFSVAPFLGMQLENSGLCYQNFIRIQTSRLIISTVSRCHTQFLCQNRVLIVCMTQDQMFHTYGQKCSQITKCHSIEYIYYINNVFKTKTTLSGTEQRKTL
jgi:hypothetical protein